MSRPLSVDCRWLVDYPPAVDPLEDRTWAEFRIQVAGHWVTHVWDREKKEPRYSIYVPLFPVVGWLVTEWWAMLYEPCRWEQGPPPAGDMQLARREWIFRHCLRTADSGLLLPRLCLYGDGPDLCLHWTADEEDAYPHMPGQFLESGFVRLPRDGAEQCLKEFISQVLTRVEGETDPRVARLRENWDAIVQADASEQAFCQCAGRMGLDPYAADEWEPALLTLLESQIGDNPNEPVVLDFLEAANAESAPSIWQWVAEAVRTKNLKGRPSPAASTMPRRGNAANAGYELAERFRAAGGLEAASPLRDVGEFSRAFLPQALSFEDLNHLPRQDVQAATGWRAGRQPLIAGPHSHETSLRFLLARGLYHLATSCQSGPRLITSAHTWDQQASRAFAAELLAPRMALAQAARSADDIEAFVAATAQRFVVSPWLIQHQLENAGLGFSAE